MSEFTVTKDEIRSLQSVQNKCYGLNVSLGWHDQPREIGTMLCLVHSEISEALEGARKNLMDSHLPKRVAVEVELADAIIRILDLAGRENLDVSSALAEKLFYNAHREDHKLENREKANGKKF